MTELVFIKQDDRGAREALVVGAKKRLDSLRGVALSAEAKYEKFKVDWEKEEQARDESIAAYDALPFFKRLFKNNPRPDLFDQTYSLMYVWSRQEEMLGLSTAWRKAAERVAEQEKEIVALESGLEVALDKINYANLMDWSEQE